MYTTIHAERSRCQLSEFDLSLKLRFEWVVFQLHCNQPVIVIEPTRSALSFLMDLTPCQLSLPHHYPTGPKWSLLFLERAPRAKLRLLLELILMTLLLVLLLLVTMMTMLLLDITITTHLVLSF